MNTSHQVDSKFILCGTHFVCDYFIPCNIQVDPNSLEIVIVYLMDMSESRARAARQKADEVAVSAAARVADLDQAESPVSIMLSSMTEEGSKERTDREVVVPWLKFLWENYRAVLELLYRIPKLEKLYHQICVKAFKFCQEYSRIMEFRRLCEMLRQHLSSLTKPKVQQMSLKNPRPLWEWTPEALDAHLQIRFSQLEVATTLELWNEAFRTIEDIFGIMVAGKFRPKPKLMVMYYEKLTRIFWVSENKLFHAYAFFKFYCLSCESKRDLKAEERTTLASSVLLSALTIPDFKDIYISSLMSAEPGDGEDAMDVRAGNEVVVSDKQNHIAQLLDFQHNPSRQALLADIMSKNILSEVVPELVALYECLEVKFQPLTLVKSLAAAMAAVKAHPDLKMYAVPLQRVIVTKVMQQLSRAYSTVRLSFVYKLLAGLNDMTEHSIEKVIVEGAAQKQLQLRINHASGSIQFTSSSSSDAALETQTAELGSSMHQVTIAIAHHQGGKAQQAQKATSRKEYFLRVLDALDEEYAQCLDRKIQIEQRKERVELLQQERELERNRRLQYEEDQRVKREQQRAEREEAEREAERNRIKQEKLELLRVQRVLESYGVTMSEEKLAALDSVARRNLIVEAQADALKAKEEDARRLTEHAKRLDHITRALRIEGASAVSRKYAAQMEADRITHEENISNSQVEMMRRHAVEKAEKARMAKMQSQRGAFEKSLLERQRAAYDIEISKIRQRLIRDRRDQNVARAYKLRAEEEERQEEELSRQEELRLKAEQERIDLENAERIRKQRLLDEEREKEKIKEREAARAKEEEDRQSRLKFMASMAEKDARKKMEEAKQAAAAPADAEKSTASRIEKAFGGSGSAGAYRPPGARSSGPTPSSAATNSRGDFSGRGESDRGGGNRAGGGGGGGSWGRGGDRGGDRTDSKANPPQPVRSGGGWGGDSSSRDRDSGGGRNYRDRDRDGGRDDRRSGGDRDGRSFDRDRKPAPENSRASGSKW